MESTNGDGDTPKAPENLSLLTDDSSTPVVNIPWKEVMPDLACGVTADNLKAKAKKKEGEPKCELADKIKEAIMDCGKCREL